MSGMILEGIRKSFGSVTALGGVDLTFPNKKLVCLLGPSGCGKTTLLRLIAGLETPDSGRIMLEGRDITPVPAHRRNFGMVFQSHALFPHLTVGENIAYGLRIRRMGKARRGEQVEKLLELVRLSGMEQRNISQLSGGQRQRVAMARALALEPSIFLLDEPLSALDAKLREEMQMELRQIHQRLGITTILVTHDQREAMTMADVVVVLDEGRVRQVGPPMEIYRNPADTFVANFIGSTNLLAGVTADSNAVRVGEQSLRVGRMAGPASPGRAVTVSVRPEEVHVFSEDSPGENRLAGTVTFVRDVGASVETFVDCAGTAIVSMASRKDNPGVAPGDRVTVELPAEACMVLSS